MRLAGYAVWFGELSVDPISAKKDGKGRIVRERFERGAFARSIEASALMGRPIKALWRHDHSIVLARTTDGTLRVWEDICGLGFEMEVDEPADKLALVRQGIVTKMSVGYDPCDHRYDTLRGETVRTVTEVFLGEISIVLAPAYWGTIVYEVRAEAMNA